MSLLNNLANKKNASGLRYLLLIPFLISWYNMLVFNFSVDAGSDSLYVFLNLPQSLSLIALIAAFIYFNVQTLRRVFLGIYLGLWSLCIAIPIFDQLMDPENTSSTVKTILGAIGVPFAYDDPDTPLSALNSLFYSYNYEKSVAQGSTVWSPNGGISFSWLLLSLSTILVIFLAIARLEKRHILEAPVTLQTSKPLAKPGHRLAALLVDFGFSIVTCGIGWFIWSIVLWNKGQTPGKMFLKIRVYDGDTGQPATFAKMARRQFIWTNILGFTFVPIRMIADRSNDYFIWVTLVIYLVFIVVSLGTYLFDSLLILRKNELRRFTDRIENTYVVNEGFKEMMI